MSTTLHQVYRNFVWRLSALAPTCKDSAETFAPFDRTKIKGDDCSGLERGFLVTWLGHGEAEEQTDRFQIAADHEFAVDVHYWAGRGYEATHEIVLQDQFDLMRELRDDSHFLGYDDDHPAVDIGICDRRTTKVSLDTTHDDLWILRLLVTVGPLKEAEE